MSKLVSHGTAVAVWEYGERASISYELILLRRSQPAIDEQYHSGFYIIFTALLQ